MRHSLEEQCTTYSMWTNTKTLYSDEEPVPLSEEEYLSAAQCARRRRALSSFEHSEHKSGGGSNQLSTWTTRTAVSHEEERKEQSQPQATKEQSQQLARKEQSQQQGQAPRGATASVRITRTTRWWFVATSRTLWWRARRRG